MNDKTLIIMRGLPGSGKSCGAKTLKGNGVIHSTDKYFIIDGEYKYNITKVRKYHLYNLFDSKMSMQNEIKPVIIDNVNIKAEHAIEYVKIALKYNYNVVVIETTHLGHLT